MLRPILTLAAAGFVGVAVWKLLWLLLFPLVGALLGFAALAVKIALFALVIWVLWRLVRSWNHRLEKVE
jgi:riboflavin transporter FmnP